MAEELGPGLARVGECRARLDGPATTCGCPKRHPSDRSFPQARVGRMVHLRELTPSQTTETRLTTLGAPPAQRESRETRAEQEQGSRLRYGVDRADISLRAALVRAERDVFAEVERAAVSRALADDRDADGLSLDEHAAAGDGQQ